jgi:cytochrome b561
VREFSIIHQGLVWALLAMVGLHLMAALMHATILRDGILSGMLFGRSKMLNNQVD